MIRPALRVRHTRACPRQLTASARHGKRSPVSWQSVDRFVLDEDGLATSVHKPRAESLRIGDETREFDYIASRCLQVQDAANSDPAWIALAIDIYRLLVRSRVAAASRRRSSPRRARRRLRS